MGGVSVYTSRRLQWIAIDCKRNQLNQKTIRNSYELTSNSIQTCPTMMRLKMNATVFVDLDGNALQLVLLIRGVDDFSSKQRL